MPNDKTTQGSNETLQELEQYEDESRYWHHRVMTGDIYDVIKERHRFDSRRIAERKPEAPRQANQSVRETEGSSVSSEGTTI